MALCATLALTSVSVATSVAAAPQPRAALIVANNEAVGKTSLRFAEREAVEMQRVLETLGGVSRTRLLLGGNATDLHAALAAFATDLDEDTTLFFYYSGHADRRGLLLGDSRVPYDELRGALERLPVRLRITIIDACHSGQITRRKGTPVPIEIAVENDEDLRGAIYITAASDSESAHESDEIAGSVFTTSLLAGLRGAADSSGDDRISLEEAYAFAYRQTLSQSNLQRPRTDFDIAGHGTLVLTELPRANSFVVVPAADGEMLVRSGDRTPLWVSGRDTPSRVVVEPGRQRVEYRDGERCAAGDLDIAAGDTATVDFESLTEVACPRRRGKGGEDAILVAAAYQGATGYLDQSGLRHGVSARALFFVGGVRVGVGAGWTGSRYVRADGLQIELQEVGGRALVEGTLANLGDADLFAGLEAGGGWVWQRGRTSALIDRVRSAPIGQWGGRVGIRWFVFSALALEASLVGGAIHFDQSGGIETAPVAQLDLGVAFAP